MNYRINELEELVGNILIRILPPLRSKGEVLLAEFEVLFEYLGELKELTRGQETINKSLAYKLFHCYIEVDKQFSFISNNENKQRIQSRLFTDIISILNEGQFQ